ncbi:unnamed protein product [Pleuronectes platessa]|uniref:Plus3 domain-containing protein n=1 Tax=Pleuronectes platessa TaxID=8262 RepID=A0A9N7VFQ4_PLEPL|nr:unnamed protein product [Pleuronectes platessa]
MLLQPVDKWSAAASGRSAGTKWKMQVEQDKGPGEKKACGEVNQPEDLRRICLSNTMLVKWSHMPYFATTVTGCFVRAVFEDSILDPPHCVAEIVSVMKAKKNYQMGSKWIDLLLKLRHAGEDKIVTLWSISNLEFKKSEFEQ